MDISLREKIACHAKENRLLSISEEEIKTLETYLILLEETSFLGKRDKDGKLIHERFFRERAVNRQETSG